LVATFQIGYILDATFRIGYILVATFRIGYILVATFQIGYILVATFRTSTGYVYVFIYRLLIETSDILNYLCFIFHMAIDY